MKSQLLLPSFRRRPESSQSLKSLDSGLRRNGGINIIVTSVVVCLLLLLCSSATASPQLNFRLDENEVPLGQSISAELVAVDFKKPISTIDLSSINPDFSVRIEEVNKVLDDPRWPGQSVQTMQLLFYPRAIGEIAIPALTFDGIKSQAHTITVTGPGKKSAAGDSDIERSLSLSTTQPWQRQQTLIEVKIAIAKSFVSLNADELKVTGFEVFELPTQTETIQRNGHKTSVVRLRWALFPLVAGQYTIDLPAIRLRKSGRTLGTHYFPLQHINVRALPPYIPPTLPVGEVSISSAPPDATMLFPGKLNFWDVTLTGNGVSPNWMPPVLRQIHSDDIDFLTGQSQPRHFSGKPGLQSEVRYHIPFKAKGNGFLRFPELRIQYFDPVSGKIISRRYTPAGMLVLSMVSRVLIGAGFFLLLGWLALTVYRQCVMIWTRSRLRKAAFAQLRSARSANELRSALHMLARAENWSENMTLRDWARQWQKSFRINADFTALFDQLARACYGNQPEFEITAFREKLLAQLK